MKSSLALILEVAMRLAAEKYIGGGNALRRPASVAEQISRTPGERSDRSTKGKLGEGGEFVMVKVYQSARGP